VLIPGYHRALFASLYSQAHIWPLMCEGDAHLLYNSFKLGDNSISFLVIYRSNLHL
jgi:hypothetical protein